MCKKLLLQVEIRVTEGTKLCLHIKYLRKRPVFFKIVNNNVRKKLISGISLICY